MTTELKLDDILASDEELFLELDDAVDEPLSEIPAVVGTLDPVQPPLCLVVEDDSAIRQMFSTRLQRAGWRVVEAEDGAAARTTAEIERPDLIVSDVHMPRASGWDLLLAVQSDRVLRRTPVILLSADDVFIENAAKADLGAAVVVSKSALRGDEVVGLAAANAGRAIALARQVASGPPFTGDLTVSTAAQLLSALVRGNVTGRLLVDNIALDSRRYEAHILAGRFAALGLYERGEVDTDLMRVLERLLLEVRGRFYFERVPIQGSGPSIHELLLALARKAPITGLEGADLSVSRGLTLDPRRYTLYKRVATPKEAALAREIIAAPNPAHAVMHSKDPVSTDRVVIDLLRKGVLRFSAQTRAPAAPVG